MHLQEQVGDETTTMVFNHCRKRPLLMLCYRRPISAEVVVMESYYLRIFLRGIEEPFIFPIVEDDQEMLQNAMDSDSRFFLFASKNREYVALSVPDIQMVNFLWEVMPTSVPGEPEEEAVTIHLRGREKPVRIEGAANPERLASFYFGLDLYSPEMERFSGFEDEDDELVYFNCDDLVLFRAPIEWIREGTDEGLDDLDAEGRGNIVKMPKKHEGQG